jgi:tetratricopeptide (TPR) repeat protein
VDAGHIEKALETFKESLALARDLNDLPNHGLIASYLGLTHRQLEQSDAACNWLSQGYRLLLEHGESADVENTASHLAELLSERGEGDAMVACHSSLREYYRNRNDQAGELRATLRLGTTYFQGGMLEHAKTLFHEGLRLSRIVCDAEREQACAAILERISTASERRDPFR